MSTSDVTTKFITVAGPQLGSGPDRIGLLLGEDSYDGDVRFTVSVNGVQVGGVQTVTAIQANGSAELFTLNGSWGAGSTVAVNFLNDDWDGTSTANGHDRNLYVDGLTFNGVSALSTVHPVNWSGPTYYPVQATVRARDFTESLGVTTHVYDLDLSYSNLPLVLSELSYIGFDHVRDGGATADPTTMMRFETMAAAGIKFDFASAPSAGFQTATANVEAMLAKYPGSIVSVEGINEVAASFSYGGLTGEDAGNLYQHDLYQAIRSDPKLSGVAVVNYTNLNIYDPDTFTRYGDISSQADYGNVHLYGYGGMSNYLSTLLPRMLEGTPNSKGFVVTETGYDTMSNGDDISAKYLLDDVFDLKQAGASMAYLYELMDDNPDPGMTNTENHFGLFNSDGTPKEAATAFHNLVAVLADPGANAATFTPGTLGYTLTGLPADGNSMLLAKSDGRFDLAVWAEPLIRASPYTSAEVTAPVSAVTVTLGTNAASVSVFDPLLGSSPIASYTDVSSLVLDVTDHPLIVQVHPKPVVPASNLDFVEATTTASSPAGNISATAVSLGSGPDRIALSMSEDAWQGDAQFTVSVDGVQVGGMVTATALHGTGQEQLVTINGTFAAGQHTISVDFLNDASAGTPETDRNLYVDRVTDGSTVATGAALLNTGSMDFLLGSTGTLAIGSGPDTILMKVSEDAWQGDAQYMVSVDGRQVGNTQIATVAHAAGQDQLVSIQGDFGSGTHDVAVTFLNDAWGGDGMDRNLYVDGLSINGTATVGAAMPSYGTHHFDITNTAVSLGQRF